MLEKKYRITVEDAETGEAPEGVELFKRVETQLAIICALGGEDDTGTAWCNMWLGTGEIDDRLLSATVHNVIGSFERLAESDKEIAGTIASALTTAVYRFLQNLRGTEGANSLPMLLPLVGQIGADE